MKSAVRLAADLVRAERADDRVRPVAQQRRGDAQVPARPARRARRRSPRRDHGATAAATCPRRAASIERGCATGEIRCVVATNALELGIDIGALDAVVCAGYPGIGRGARGSASAAPGAGGAASIACWSPRARRSISTSRASPSYLLGAPVEEARIDPDNVEILVQHLKCAAFELPFERGETLRRRRAARRPREALEFLAQHQVRARHERGRHVFHWAADAYPANNVSLRSVGWDNVVIIDAGHDRTLAEMDWRSRAHDAARAGHLPARRRAVAGRALRLREPQGVRAQGGARLLHRRDDATRG